MKDGWRMSLGYEIEINTFKIYKINDELDIILNSLINMDDEKTWIDFVLCF